MNDWVQRKPLRLQNYDYGQAGYYFVTLCTALRGQDILSSITVGDGLCAVPFTKLTAIGQIVDRSICEIPQRYPGTAIDTYCVMPDHVHMIVILGRRDTGKTGRDRARPLQDIIGAMKSYTDRQYRAFGMPFEAKLWQKSYYDHIIRNREDLQNIRQYILSNPLKWISKE